MFAFIMKKKAESIIREIRGIGIPASVKVVASWPDELVNRVVQADEDGDRVKIESLASDHLAAEAELDDTTTTDEA